MSNSPLVSVTKISPNKNAPRNHKIDTITIHCLVGQASAESIGNYFQNRSIQASCNYGIGTDGRVVLVVDEADRSWCSSNAANDNRAITIECASDTEHPYAINDKVYRSLIELCADICKRNGIPGLKWKADKSLIGQPDKQNMTVHRWFANKACPGDYIYQRLGTIAAEVNHILDTDNKPEPAPVAVDGKGIKAANIAFMSEKEVVEKIGPLCTADQKKTGILASVSMAQFILESGYAKTELAQKANNCFGMKATLSNNTWSGSVWKGDVYRKKTQEYVNGGYITVEADFRSYSCIEESIEDHSAYLLGATNGSKKRYDGLKGEKDYRKAIRIIKNGGYATDPLYVDKICKIVEKWDLTRFDVDAEVKEPSKTKEPEKDSSFLVRVRITNLNIRSGPGTNFSRVRFIEPGVFTIVDVKQGQGSESGFGKLKSGIGWISLDYVDIMK